MKPIRIRSLVLALALVPLGVGGVRASETDDSQSGKVVISGSVLRKEGVFEIRAETRLEDLLNQAGCHSRTAFHHIKVWRVIDGEPYELRVSNRPPDNSDDLEPFRVKNEDIIGVPDYFQVGIPVTVSGPFYVVEKKEKDWTAKEAEEKAAPKEEPASVEK